jgi:CHAT domain-containing protein/tetratricopeptide (TPR) repeat protein
MKRVIASRLVIMLVTAIVLATIVSSGGKAKGVDRLTELNDKIAQLYDQEKYDQAVPLAKEALELTRARKGSDNLDTGIRLAWLASLYLRNQNLADAEPVVKHAVFILEKTQGSNEALAGRTLCALALPYIDLGRYHEAQTLLELALAKAEKTAGPDRADVGMALESLGQVYLGQGRYAEAESAVKRSLVIRENALGRDHLRVAQSLNNLAFLYRTLGRHAEAEPLFKRSLAIAEKVSEPDSKGYTLAVGQLTGALKGLAGLYVDQGRFAEAEPLYKRDLALLEKALGPEGFLIGFVLNDLAVLYEKEGRYAELEPLLKRGLAIIEKAAGHDSPRLLGLLNNLAVIYAGQHRYTEAEQNYRRALAINERELGTEHPDVAHVLSNLASLYQTQSRYVEAETTYQRAIAINEKAFGRDNFELVVPLNNLASLYRTESRYADAAHLYNRVLEIIERAFGSDHPDAVVVLNNLARLYYAQRDWGTAADYWQRSTNLVIRRISRTSEGAGEAATNKRDTERFSMLVKAVYRAATDQHDTSATLARDVFETAQWASTSEAAAAITQMAMRGAKGQLQLSHLVRERQDLVAEWQKRDGVRTAAWSKAADTRDSAADAANVTRLAEIDTRLAEIDKRLANEFGEYAALALPAALSVEEVQTNLRPDEALILFLDTPKVGQTSEETFIWIVTKTDMRWVRSELGTSALEREVGALRCGLDAASWEGEGARKCSELLAISPDKMPRGNELPFDLARAHLLYKSLLGGAEDLIKGKNLVVVPSGPLTQLPFQVLVATLSNNVPSGDRERQVGHLSAELQPLYLDASNARSVQWIIRDHALTILPAVSSLKSLREFAKQSRASEPYIGFGNPLLDGEPSKYEGDAAAAKHARERRCDPKLRQHVASLLSLQRGTAGITHDSGGVVKISDIQRLEPLPETADELCDVALDLGVDPASDVYLGAKATEAEVKKLSGDGILAKYKIVHFATHGALAGQISSASEPGLVLTPPALARDGDDGYLSASEVAALKLDADWVILSACNTAAGGASGAEALSGLARAFFYAGARSLLVSHWAVNSNATVKLITGSVAEQKAHLGIGRAEALRRSMMAMIENGEVYEAHPAFWAPFVLVGEGAP